MLSKKEIEKAKDDLKELYRLLNPKSTTSTNAIKTILQYIDQLEQENRQLKVGLNSGLDKDKKNCFYEDGHTGKCLGFSYFNNDEPCEYCKSCEILSIQGDD